MRNKIKSFKYIYIIYNKIYTTNINITKKSQLIIIKKRKKVKR